MRTEGGSGDGVTSKGLADEPPLEQAPVVTKSNLDAALARLPSFVGQEMEKTGVPGVAVAVVWHDEVVFMQGFGLRDVGKPEPVDADTVFELASVSKPLASTVVAGVVGQGKVKWTDPVVELTPGFALADPYITQHVTLADLFSHRSGLPDHAGDLLEDLGYGRDYVLEHLRQEPLSPFRASYAYTNFGLTQAAVSVAEAMATSWEDLAASLLFEPLGMASASFRFDDYANAANKAVNHIKDGDAWAAKYVRNPDAQSPAGGASSSVRDLTKWVRLQLAEGKFEGEHVIDAGALAETHLPHSVSAPPRTAAGRTGFYGLGWNVGYDALGRVMLGHSGAFMLGAATNVSMLPTDGLGIIVLTNASPIGLAETIAFELLDEATYGHPTVDWPAFLSRVFTVPDPHADENDDSKAPASAAQARDVSAYVGTYANDYYGPITISSRKEQLVMQLGAKRTEFPLTHERGDDFSYTSTAEFGFGASGVTFDVPEAGTTATTVRLTTLDRTGLGKFTRT
jgi:CubicO group peptidase (beta-lactamase class C family)